MGPAAGESVVERTLARVGESDESEAFHPGGGYRRSPRVPWGTVTDVTASSATSATEAAGTDTVASAERAFSKSLFVSGVRCTLTYVLIPFVFPLVGWGTGAGPWIGLPIGIAAIVANIVSVRRLHRADHRMKWPMSALSGGILVLLAILVVVDLGEILG